MDDKKKLTLTFTASSDEIIKAAKVLKIGEVEVEEDEKEKRYIRFTGIKSKSIKRGYVRRSKSRKFIAVPRLVLRFSEPADTTLVDLFNSWIEAAIGKDDDTYKREYNKNLWKQL